MSINDASDVTPLLAVASAPLQNHPRRNNNRSEYRRTASPSQRHDVSHSKYMEGHRNSSDGMDGSDGQDVAGVKYQSAYKAHAQRTGQFAGARVDAIGVALLATLLSVMAHISISSTMFPPGTNRHFEVYVGLGLYWGLFAAALTNWWLFATTRFPSAVGGE